MEFGLPYVVVNSIAGYSIGFRRSGRSKRETGMASTSLSDLLPVSLEMGERQAEKVQL